jgi:hypothetical protein
MPWGQGAAYIVLRGCLATIRSNDLDLRPRCSFLGRLGNLLEHTQSGVTTAARGRRSVSLWGRSVPGGPRFGPSLTGACVSSRRFQKVLIHVKRSPYERVMPVLSNPALRLISSDSELRIWQMIYPFRSSQRALRNIALQLLI